MLLTVNHFLQAKYLVRRRRNSPRSSLIWLRSTCCSIVLEFPSSTQRSRRGGSLLELVWSGCRVVLASASLLSIGLCSFKGSSGFKGWRFWMNRLYNFCRLSELPDIVCQKPLVLIEEQYRFWSSIPSSFTAPGSSSMKSSNQRTPSHCIIFSMMPI